MAPTPETQANFGDALGLDGKTVLFVEDNMILALDGEDTFRALGAEHVVVANSVASALEVLETTDVDLAVLDVSLTRETSLSVAQACQSIGIPIILTTGYGGTESILTAFPRAPVCVKPYTRDQLKAALGQLKAS